MKQMLIFQIMQQQQQQQQQQQMRALTDQIVNPELLVRTGLPALLQQLSNQQPHYKVSMVATVVILLLLSLYYFLSILSLYYFLY